MSPLHRHQLQEPKRSYRIIIVRCCTRVTCTCILCNVGISWCASPFIAYETFFLLLNNDNITCIETGHFNVVSEWLTTV